MNSLDYKDYGNFGSHWSPAKNETIHLKVDEKNSKIYVKIDSQGWLEKILPQEIFGRKLSFGRSAKESHEYSITLDRGLGKKDLKNAIKNGTVEEVIQGRAQPVSKKVERSIQKKAQQALNQRVKLVEVSKRDIDKVANNLMKLKNSQTISEKEAKPIEDKISDLKGRYDGLKKGRVQSFHEKNVLLDFKQAIDFQVKAVSTVKAYKAIRKGQEKETETPRTPQRTPRTSQPEIKHKGETEKFFPQFLRKPPESLRTEYANLEGQKDDLLILDKKAQEIQNKLHEKYNEVYKKYSDNGKTGTRELVLLNKMNLFNQQIEAYRNEIAESKLSSENLQDLLKAMNFDYLSIENLCKKRDVTNEDLKTSNMHNTWKEINPENESASSKKNDEANKELNDGKTHITRGIQKED